MGRFKRSTATIKGVGYSTKDDLSQLGKKVFKALKLVFEDVPDAAKGAKTTNAC